ncbi:MAG: type I DNA topoisomerase [Lachnospiraceae bacterium]|nr:type I DNA topoisomerase [Lachnospiraceae bacterium]
MAKYLVIVESPAKVKTIKKFLGSNYEVMASYGHVRDLPKSRLGFSPDSDYEPQYITIRGKGDVLAALRKEVKKAEKIYLATDPDREGEAISWHLLEALNKGDKKFYRITFNEITKNAVKESLKNARDINMDLVNAQQARRMLDRMVGYRISPLLWAKIKRGLSAGRVQSVALRIICDREEEIAAFIPSEYWSVEAKLGIKGSKKSFVASYYSDASGNKEIKSAKEADAIEKSLKSAKYTIKDIKTGERTRKAPLPFTTSTLQQEASKVLNMATQKTMSVAQQLYEDGRITYLRTDSTRISDEAVAMAKDYISEVYGAEYATEVTRENNKEKKIQDAHEAIRPTDISKTPESLKNTLPRDQYRLYQLIWKRFTASRMNNAVYDTMSVKLSAADYIFTTSASSIRFDGFLKVYSDGEDDKDSNAFILKALNKDSEIIFESLDKKQHFTQPPAHYTEASLVRALEELGIGRPSTYAPTISTILGRRYILKENRNLFVSDLGEVVNNMMKNSFPSIVDVNFTATFESLLDSVEVGDVDWKMVVSNFYPDLDEAVNVAEKELEHIEIKDEVTDVICDECGRNMVIKYGPHGKFLACPGFPECRNTKPFLEKIGVKCPDCGKDLIVRKTQKGRRYYGCEGYPECEFMSWNMPVDKKCPKCGKIMVRKGNNLACIDQECGTIIPSEEE